MILTIYENRVESNQDTAWTIVWVNKIRNLFKVVYGTSVDIMVD